MSDKPEDWDRSRDEIISGEYVLGVLSEADRRRVEVRIASDPKFANQVRRWQTNLADFNGDYEDVRPTAEPSGKNEKRRFDLTNAAKPNLLQFLWGSTPVWRGLTAAAVIAAVGIGVVDRVTPHPAGPGKALVAELTGMDSPISLVATFDVASGQLNIVPAALKGQSPKSLQVWLIEDGDAPTSLGVMPENGDGDIFVSRAMRRDFATGKTIAITIEPLGGSPSGKPTGAVIALGKTKPQ